MRKISLIVFSLLSLFILFSCEKDETKAVLDMSKTQPAVLSEPVDASDFMLLEDNADSMFTFNWSATSYNLDNLGDIKYRLQIDMADSNFVNAKQLAEITETTFSMSVLDLNNTLLSMGIIADSTATVEIRVVSSLNASTNYTEATSQITKVNFTPYLSGGAAAPSLYLIGDGTTTGWDNTNISLQFSFDADLEVYKIVATLGGAGKFFKAFGVQGQWAPQWGTDATGTSAGGPLVYRPDETVADPAAIPAPELAGDYLITFDLVNMVYTVVVADIPQTMHIIGDATEAGWTNTIAIPMEKLAPGKFQLVANLSATATEGFKFLVNQGAWAPMYGTVVGASFTDGILVARPTEADPDPKAIPPPPATGSYLIVMDVVGMVYTVTAQ